MSEQAFQIDKQQARLAFEKSATSYDEAAVLQREIGNRMLERLDYINHQPKMILDVGAGTGFCAHHLAERYAKSEIYALDFAVNMLRQARASTSWWQRLRHRFTFIAGDAEQLPLADGSIDMLVSSLAIQWCNDLDRVFAEFRRVLAPGGMLMFTTFGPDTLKELRASWAEADGVSHVNQFFDMHDIGDALMRHGFAEPVMDTEYLTMTYRDALTLMKDLKQIGAHNVMQGRSRHLTSKSQLKQMLAAYEQFRADGVLPASYEVVYGHAWAPVPQQSVIPVTQFQPATK